MPPLPPNAVILITASSAGLGAETARAFAATGARVILNYNSNQSKAEAVIKELESLQPETLKSDGDGGKEKRFIAIKADASRREEIGWLVEEGVKRMGRLDCVVSNHGWTRIRNFQDLDDNLEESDWDVCFNFNVKSHLWAFHAAKKHLEKTDGSFITTASTAGVIPSGSSIAYSVTKAAQIHLVKALASISGPHIRVNSVSPGLLLTEWGLQFSQAAIDRTIDKSVLKRIATVEDCARQIVCITNNSSQTGTNTVIDGGLDRPRPSSGSTPSFKKHCHMSSQHVDDSVFHLFPRFPQELQDRIWQQAIESIGPRAVGFQALSRFRANEVPVANVSSSTIPNVLHACRDARNLALQRWQPSFATEDPAKIYFDFRLDTLVFFVHDPNYEYSFTEIDLFVAYTEAADRERLSRIAIDFQIEYERETFRDGGLLASMLHDGIPNLKEIVLLCMDLDDWEYDLSGRDPRRLSDPANTDIEFVALQEGDIFKEVLEEEYGAFIDEFEREIQRAGWNPELKYMNFRRKDPNLKTKSLPLNDEHQEEHSCRHI
ncbi:hypothetical protein G7Y89_g1366 [Cudoniella acicularis]|uniref:2EXR domain-containing protein n=1 Tax=Cudoniella acicularis TaxID=354080 RepID=A0A8H4W7Z5_9HELO|nr:hypothetical protein G7Y89_g1366 [Cudoniella acicularis]